MENCSILTGNRINHKMISEAIQLDRISYPGAYQLQVETCYNYFESNNDIYIMAVDDKSGHVIGYINLARLKNQYLTR